MEEPLKETQARQASWVAHGLGITRVRGVVSARLIKRSDLVPASTSISGVVSIPASRALALKLLILVPPCVPFLASSSALELRVSLCVVPLEEPPRL